MAELEPKLKWAILGVPTVVFLLMGVMWKTSGDVPVSWNGVLLLAPLGFGIGWMILNVYTVADNV
ncbi:hypothetical protein [Halobacterium wangiae]|uniref:hypothetical protein n=1 Tax=Halobacterium wangiae TaxID=2902623 RepID=UPI001E2FBA86|nr:hypothetical protein [Halobacterium wangiae]